MEVGPITVSHPDDNLKPGKVGKFVSKMMGGPGATTAKAPDEYVRAAQQVLNQYYATQVLKEDGIMGNETHRILKWFQKQNGLPETGDIDPATRTALASRLAERAGQQGGLQPGGDDPTSDSSWLISRIHAQDTATSGFWPDPYYGMW
jgi:peptidoglycan hydrolase-like protein with peptidoglycan-binding domain